VGKKLPAKGESTKPRDQKRKSELRISYSFHARKAIPGERGLTWTQRGWGATKEGEARTKAEKGAGDTTGGREKHIGISGSGHKYLEYREKKSELERGRDQGRGKEEQFNKKFGGVGRRDGKMGVRLRSERKRDLGDGDFSHTVLWA